MAFGTEGLLLRFLDLLALSLSALRYHKVRLILTTLGVVFGSLVLAISLSVREGVHETVSYEYQKHGELRLIEVHRGRFSKNVKPPPEVVTVKGNVGEERRKRLEQELTDRWQRGFVAPDDEEPRGLSREQTAQLAALDHVKSVKPLVFLSCRVSLDGKSLHAEGQGAAPQEPNLKEQIVAGDVFAAADSQSVIVSEFLLYELGVVDDDAVAGVIGKKLHLEFQSGVPSRFAVLSLFQGGGRKVSVEEERTLESIAARLPEALKKMDLEPQEKKLLEILIAEQAAKAETPVLINRELTICGVIASGDGVGKAKRSRFSWTYRGQDLVFPIKAAEEIFFHFPHPKKHGFDRVFVEVDHIDNVKEVNEKIRSMGMHTETLSEYIEREQFTYLMIFSSMTIVALIALLVAALGITNTMLMSVLERVREIGIMKAVGARELHIRLIFLIEGGLLGLVGGGLGLLLAWSATFPADAWVKSMVERRLNIQLDQSIFAFPWWLVVGVPFFAWLVTTVAAYYPARRASRIDPIQALRHE